jgi:hypothetical protein
MSTVKLIVEVLERIKPIEIAYYVSQLKNSMRNFGYDDCTLSTILYRETSQITTTGGTLESLLKNRHSTTYAILQMLFDVKLCMFHGIIRNALNECGLSQYGSSKCRYRG